MTQEELHAKYELTDHADPCGELDAIITQKESQVSFRQQFMDTHEEALASIAMLATARLQHEDALAAKDAEIAALTPLRALYEEMTIKVTAALDSGDPERFIALGTEFLAPEKERRRARLQAELDALGE